MIAKSTVSRLLSSEPNPASMGVEEQARLAALIRDAVQLEEA